MPLLRNRSGLGLSPFQEDEFQVYSQRRGLTRNFGIGQVLNPEEESDEDRAVILQTNEDRERENEEDEFAIYDIPLRNERDLAVTG